MNMARIIRSGIYVIALALVIFPSLSSKAFARPVVEVLEIRFNHNSTSWTRDGLNIRRNYNTAVALPEWRRGETNPQDSPAAFVGGRIVDVMVKVRASRSGTYEIRAAGGPFRISPRVVSLSRRTARWVRFETTRIPAVVRIADVAWHWRVRKKQFWWWGSEFSAGTSYHRFYTVLHAPNGPWKQQPYLDNRNLWTEALDIAAALAYGRTNMTGAVHDIWDDFYNNAGGVYDVIGGYPQYTGGTSHNFNLTKWLSNYNSGSIGTVNCYDMGKAVVIFANALGADSVYTYVNPFGYLNCVNPIGRGWTNNPFYESPDCNSNPIVGEDDSYSSNRRCSFGNHGFTRFRDQIYDGSGGRVDADTNPDNCFSAAVTPRNLDGNDSWLSDYKNRVIDDYPTFSSGTGPTTNYSFDVY